MTPTPEQVEAVAQASGGYSDEEWADILTGDDPLDGLTLRNARAVAQNILSSPVALAALTSVNQWRPISEAPKDGTWFLALPRAGEGFCGEPYPPTVARLMGPYFNIDTGEKDEWSIECKAMNSGSTFSDLEKFTHFMPLPDPPKE
jgi:hypothetical protein